jgi:hypothetical protein
MLYVVTFTFLGWTKEIEVNAQSLLLATKKGMKVAKAYSRWSRLISVVERESMEREKINY